MMKLNLYLMPLNKILEIYYTYVSLTQPMAKYILWKLTTFLFLREWIREGGYSEQNEDDHKKKSCKVNEGVFFGELCNLWGDMVA